MVNKKVVWYTANSVRKTQIYNWLKEVLYANNLSESLYIVRNLAYKGHIKESLAKFNDIILYLIDNKRSVMPRDGNILAYLIDENINLFGKSRVILDLYRGIIKVPKGKHIPKKVGRATTKKLDEVKEEIGKAQVVHYGIDTEGKRKQANIRIVLINEKEVYQLVDKETGKVLKYTDSFKKELEKRKKEND